jgi:hypothetical protein
VFITTPGQVCPFSILRVHLMYPAFILWPTSVYSARNCSSILEMFSINIWNLQMLSNIDTWVWIGLWSTCLQIARMM